MKWDFLLMMLHYNKADVLFFFLHRFVHVVQREVCISPGTISVLCAEGTTSFDLAEF